MTVPRLAILTNFVSPFRVPVYEELAKHVGDLRLFIATRMEPNRPWKPDWGRLDVKVQRAITFTRKWRHPHGFSEENYIHFPLDTIPQLYRFRPDVIISVGFGLSSLQAWLYRCLNPKTRLVIWASVSEHTEKGRGRTRNLVRPLLARAADSLIVNGSSGSRYIRQLGVPSERIFQAPQTTYVERFNSLGLSRDAASARRLIFSGQIVERKGLSPFLQSLAAWGIAHPKEKIEFWLVGDGPQRSALEKFPIPPNVSLRFPGNMEYDRMPEFYAQAGILVFPTFADTWGLIVNEAMAAGLPVLGSLYGQAVEDLVVDGETGWVFRPDNSQEMERAINRALSISSVDLEKMRPLCRAKVEHLTPAFVANRMLDAIHYSLERYLNRAAGTP